MTTQPRKPVPTRDPAQDPTSDPTWDPTAKNDLAAGQEEVLNQSTVDVLLNLTPEDLIVSDDEAELIKGSAKRPGGWLHAPGRLELFASADRRLTKVANQRGISGKRVDKVIARLVKGTKLLILQGSRVDDMTALPVTRRASSPGAWINLFTLLSEAGLTVPTGYRERYDVVYVPKGSILAPGLLIDLGKPLERRSESRGRKAGAEPDAVTSAIPAEKAKPEGQEPTE